MGLRLSLIHILTPPLYFAHRLYRQRQWLNLSARGSQDVYKRQAGESWRVFTRSRYENVLGKDESYD